MNVLTVREGNGMLKVYTSYMVESLEAQVARIKSDNAALRAEVAALKERCETTRELESAVVDLTCTVSDLKAQLAQQAIEVAALRDYQAKALATIGYDTDELYRLKQEVAALKIQLAERELEYQNQLGEAEAANESLRAEHLALIAAGLLMKAATP